MLPIGLVLLSVLACTADSSDTSVAPQPLDLPEDPAATGVPVGVRTVTNGDLTLEIWYPADDAVAGQAGETVDTTVFVPESVQELLGGLVLPGLATSAVRDAPPRPTDQAFPVVLFSHGFGAFRQQSVDLTTHLASRGYVVVAADHPGRMLGDVLPCLFSPPLDGCDLTGFTQDPAVDHMEDAVDVVRALAADDWLAGVAAADQLAAVGHSAGAGTVTTLAAERDDIIAVLPMAGGGAVQQDLPTLYMSGTCDPFPGIDAVTASYQGATDARLVALRSAGHLAFSDICELELGQMAEDLLSTREDINSTYYDGLIQLATDGCPGATPDPALDGCDAFLDLSVSTPIIRHYATVFLDASVRGQGDGVVAGEFPEAAVSLGR